MARKKKHRRSRRRRNPWNRNAWIAFGVTAVVVAGGGILLVRRHRRALPGTGGTQGSSGPIVGGVGHKQLQSEINWLCQQPATLPLAAQQALINGIFVPTMNRELAKIPAQPTLGQIDAVVASVADLIVNQLCQPATAASRAKALQLSHAAWLKTQGMTGQ